MNDQLIEKQESGPCCQNCKYVHKAGVNKETLRSYFECHRYPPTVVVLPHPTQGAMPASFYPPTQAQLSCGEFSALQLVLTH